MVDRFLKKMQDTFLGNNQEEDLNQDAYRDQFGNVVPASEDPYGDPAYQYQNDSQSQFGDAIPASQDPYGDPADYGMTDNYGQFGDVRPASEDPYGDPADEENGRY